MALSKKSLTDLEKLISDMSPEQFRALKNDIDTKLYPEMDLEELTAARDKINDLINSLKEAEREKFMVEAREWAEKAKQLGLNLGSALGVSPPVRERVRLSSSENADGRAKPEIKYRNPKNHNETWKARGKRPIWIVRELAMRGMDGDAAIPDEFKIENQ